MAETKIEWTDKTWNPVTGCTKYSEGCQHCYAEVMARRLKGMGQTKYKNAFRLTIHPEDLDEPLKWIKPHNIFVCSMGDLFHKDVPFEFIDKVMQTIRETPRHRYQILTKRAERMQEYFSTRPVPQNAWLGVSVEVQSSCFRINCLRNLPAPVRFLSCEPLLEDLGQMDLSGINWIIVGGESGMQARPMQESWVLNIKKQAEKIGAAFFFKQWGTWGQDGIKRNKRANGKLLQGKIFQQMPYDVH
ncbi:MAG: phage Gp37/Gp68 family protein [Paludibacteraceae bacterium]|nr:phage Gp37/Gp68 family protein [Paludibacteraceae bacterium]